ncbi:MAG: ATP-binding protein [Clostridia bacterium]|nr:ATP-binding protein [Clostridia bacterium]
MIIRHGYLEKIKSYKDMQLIKVVTGIRRCGKSTLLKLYKDNLLRDGVDEKQIIFINLEEKENEALKNVDALYDYITGNLVKDEMNYIFIDEVQECKNFQTAVDSLFIKDNVDIYITGSNAHMLSGELATLLSGRYVTIEMLPLSFVEYLQGAGEDSIESKYRDYLRFGSFPFVLQFKGNEEQIRNYLDGLYNTIFKKDIVRRNGIKNEDALESVTRFVFDNIGNLVTSKKISDTLTSNNCKVSQPTVEGYLKALADSFFVYRVTRYDVKGKQYLKSMAKYYVTDLGMRNNLLGYKSSNRGAVLENTVFLELIRRGYKVFIGKVENGEIDFVVFKGSETVYIQVAESIKDEAVFEREMKPLRTVKDFNKRVVITTDYDVNESYDGIRHINIIDFLLGKKNI